MSDSTAITTLPRHELVERYGISAQQARFAEEYLVDLDSAAAAVRAGYKPNGARVQGSRLLNHIGVSQYISDLMAARSQRVGLTADQVLRELAVLATSNVVNYELNELGNLDLAEGASPEELRAIQSIKRTVRYDKDGNKTVETEYRLWDKVAALKLAGKHLGMFTELHAHLIKGEIEHKQVWEFGGRKIEF